MRTVGHTRKELEQYKASGFGYEFRVQLHKCLKRLLLEVTSQKDTRMQTQYLKEVYEWYFKRLIAMGALSKEEYAAEYKCLNPLTDKMADAMRKVVNQKL